MPIATARTSGLSPARRSLNRLVVALVTAFLVILVLAPTPSKRPVMQTLLAVVMAMFGWSAWPSIGILRTSSRTRERFEGALVAAMCVAGLCGTGWVLIESTGGQ